MNLKYGHKRRKTICEARGHFNLKHLRRREVWLWKFSKICAAVADERETKSWNPEAHAARRNEMKKADGLAWVQGVRLIQRLLDG
jgi:hypothetical protein